MSNPLTIIEYLEKFNDSFTMNVMEYYMDENDEKFHKFLQDFDISAQDFMDYVSYVFDTPQENIEMFSA